MQTDASRELPTVTNTYSVLEARYRPPTHCCTAFSPRKRCCTVEPRCSDHTTGNLHFLQPVSARMYACTSAKRVCTFSRRVLAPSLKWMMLGKMNASGVQQSAPVHSRRGGLGGTSLEGQKRTGGPQMVMYVDMWICHVVLVVICEHALMCKVARGKKRSFSGTGRPALGALCPQVCEKEEQAWKARTNGSKHPDNIQQKGGYPPHHHHHHSRCTRKHQGGEGFGGLVAKIPQINKPSVALLSCGHSFGPIGMGSSLMCLVSGQFLSKRLSRAGGWQTTVARLPGAGGGGGAWEGGFWEGR